MDVNLRILPPKLIKESCLQTLSFFEKNALVLYKNEGLNGQIRIIESNSCTDCFGAVYAY